jgi:hypothetical protein
MKVGIGSVSIKYLTFLHRVEVLFGELERGIPSLIVDMAFFLLYVDSINKLRRITTCKKLILA